MYVKSFNHQLQLIRKYPQLLERMLYAFCIVYIKSVYIYLLNIHLAFVKKILRSDQIATYMELVVKL